MGTQIGDNSVKEVDTMTKKLIKEQAEMSRDEAIAKAFEACDEATVSARWKRDEEVAKARRACKEAIAQAERKQEEV